MRLSDGFVIDKEKTFGELKFTAVRDVFLQNEDGTPSTQLKKRIYDLKCSLHGGIIPVSVPPEVPLREFPYNAVVELVNPVADTRRAPRLLLLRSLRRRLWLPVRRSPRCVKLREWVSPGTSACSTRCTSWATWPQRSTMSCR